MTGLAPMRQMAHRQLLIAGGGIGGLAAGLAASQAGWEVRLFERVPQFAEFGAGVQLGPNVTRVLQRWGLADELRRIAAFPDVLQARSASDGALLGELPLGMAMQQRYGAPYATVHRADLHRMLLRALRVRDGVWLRLATAVRRFDDLGDRVQIEIDIQAPTATPGTAARVDAAPLQALIEGDALLAADGIGSRLRQQLLGDGPPRVPGHLAYRAVVPQALLPAALADNRVRVWLGAALHVVEYPVSGGEWRNIVAIVEGRLEGDIESWDHGANAEQLRRALFPAAAAPALRALVEAVPAWRLWVLRDRAPVASAGQMARGLVALLGDAAHPMRPYLAQGAGMAIEDAAELGHALAMPDVEPALMLRRYALARWQRAARVQARSVRNGDVFHARGLVRLGRDASMRWLGARIMDLPWLYGHGQG